MSTAARAVRPARDAASAQEFDHIRPPASGRPGDDERQRRQRWSSDTGTGARERVVGGHHDAQPLPPQHLLAQSGRERRLQGGSDGHRDAVGEEASDDIVPGSCSSERDTDAGMTRPQLREDPREERGTDTRGGEHRDRPPGVEPAQRSDRRARRADPCHDLSRMPREHLARRRHACGSVTTVDQPHAQLALECGDVRAHPRLRAMDLLDAAVNPPRSTTARKVSSQSISTLRHRSRALARLAPGTHPRITGCRTTRGSADSMRLTDGCPRNVALVYGAPHLPMRVADHLTSGDPRETREVSTWQATPRRPDARSRARSRPSCMTFTEGSEHSLTEIARLAGLPISTAHRLTSELASWRLLERTDGRSVPRGLPLRMIGTVDACPPSIAGARARACWRTCPRRPAAGRGSGSCRISRSPTSRSSPGRGRTTSFTPAATLPAHPTALGRALLAFSPARHRRDDDHAGPAGRTPRTPSPHPTASAARSRSPGSPAWPSPGSSWRPAVCGVAMPVFGPGGDVVAAIELAVARPGPRAAAGHGSARHRGPQPVPRTRRRGPARPGARCHTSRGVDARSVHSRSASDPRAIRSASAGRGGRSDSGPDVLARARRPGPGAARCPCAAACRIGPECLRRPLRPVLPPRAADLARSAPRHAAALAVGSASALGRPCATPWGPAG